MSISYDLSRFVTAQEAVIARVLDELGAGRKASHWMWFVFPQIAGLGFSTMAQRYAIADRGEARAYLDHPVLGARLRTCTETVLAVPNRTAHEIFGSPDDMKFRSSMTLFAAVADDPLVFQQALSRFYDGEPDRATLARLSQ